MAKDNDRKQRVQEAVKEIEGTIDSKNLAPIDAFHLKYGEKTRQCEKQGKNLSLSKLSMRARFFAFKVKSGLLWKTT